MIISKNISNMGSYNQYKKFYITRINDRVVIWMLFNNKIQFGYGGVLMILFLAQIVKNNKSLKYIYMYNIIKLNSFLTTTIRLCFNFIIIQTITNCIIYYRNLQYIINIEWNDYYEYEIESFNIKLYVYSIMWRN